MLLRLQYLAYLLAVLCLFWMPPFTAVSYREWREAVMYCWHIVRTGDVWHAPTR